MLEINLENELLKIEKIDVDNRIRKAIISPEIESKIFKMKKITYIMMIILFIVGFIIICIGAFFQNKEQKSIMISLIVLGVIFFLCILIVAFVSSIFSFRILKTSSTKHINEALINDIFIVLGSKIENIKFVSFSFIDHYTEIKFIFDNSEYLLTKQNNEIVLLNQNQIINNKSLMKYYNSEITYKINIIDSYKKSSIENFIEFVSDEIKYKFQMIIKDINLFLQENKGTQ